MHEHQGNCCRGESPRSRGAAPGDRDLGIALWITLGFAVLEFGGGYMGGSMALMSDAFHMLTDAGSLGLSMLAARLALKAGTESKTFGYRRAEVLAALANGAALWVVAGALLMKTWDRFLNPSQIAAGITLAVAFAGLAANIAAAWILSARHRENINVRGAFLHVLADAAVSVGVIVSVLAIKITGQAVIDPLVSLAIIVATLAGAWRLVGESLHILMEGSPAHIGQEEVIRSLMSMEGVLNVHELHVWSVTRGFDALSAHILVKDPSLSCGILKRACVMLKERYGISHSTLQVETEMGHSSCRSPACAENKNV